MDKLSKNNMENVSGGVIKFVTRYQLGQHGHGEAKYYYEVYDDKTGKLVKRQRAFFIPAKNDAEKAMDKAQLDSLKFLNNMTNN